jgi:protocatechuate 3,4-dioxygenase beta subunit
VKLEAYPLEGTGPPGPVYRTMRLLLVPLLAAVLAAGCDRFQSDPPEHIHMLVSAEGFEPLASNRYHPEGRSAGRFDVLLTPAPS